MHGDDARTARTGDDRLRLAQIAADATAAAAGAAVQELLFQWRTGHGAGHNLLLLLLLQLTNGRLQWLLLLLLLNHLWRQWELFEVLLRLVRGRGLLQVLRLLLHHNGRRLRVLRLLQVQRQRHRMRLMLLYMAGRRLGRQLFGGRNDGGRCGSGAMLLQLDGRMLLLQYQLWLGWRLSRRHLNDVLRFRGALLRRRRCSYRMLLLLLLADHLDVLMVGKQMGWNAGGRRNAG